MNRRDFIKASIATSGALWLEDWQKAFAKGKKDRAVGHPWKGWKEGQFQVHFIYTGVAESLFLIFPDGTTMLLDCGDHNAIGRGKLAVPILPDASRHAGEWIARYVERVNPHHKDVDYMMLSHYHSDHAGCGTFYASKVMKEGEEYALSGFSQAAETLNFCKAIDRCWPDYNDPIPLLPEADGETVSHMQEFYEYMQKYKGLKIEKIRLGASDQIVPLRSPSACKDFRVRNICGNGRIVTPDGTIRDLYAERKASNPKKLNENGMCLGFIFSYGDFRFFTVGDFSDKWKLADGQMFEIEDALAEVCGQAHVAKISHHGHFSMPEKLIAALRSQVYIACIWDQLHIVDPVMKRLSDRNIYPDERVICPGILTAERRQEDAGKAWLNDVPTAAYQGSHVVLNVEKGGTKYSISYLTAEDESMNVKSVLHFRT